MDFKGIENSRGWLVRLLVAALLLISLALFWRMILPLQLNGNDEWNVFKEYASSRDAGDIVRETFLPHNNHFIPLHKLLILVMYSIFSVEHLPYNIMSILLLAVALMLFYSFTSEAIEDKAAAALSTLAMGTTSAYYGIMVWAFTHGNILSMIFLLLALIYTHKGLKKGSVRYFIAATTASLVSGLFFTTGLLAAPLASIYVIVYSLTGKRDALKVISARIAILMSSMLLYIPVFLYVIGERVTASKISLSPYLVIKTTLVIIGNMVIKELLPMYMNIITAFDRFMGIDSTSASAVNAKLTIICLTVFTFVALAMFLIYRKAPDKVRSMILFGSVFIASFAGLHAVGRADTYDGGLYTLLSINRYNYFPLTGFFMITAACISHFNKFSGKKVLYAFAALVLGLGAFHQSVLIKASSDLKDLRSSRIKLMSQIAYKMDHTDSVALPLDPGSLDLWKYFSIYKTKDDAVIGSPHMLYILRSHVDVKPEDIVVAKGRADVEKGEIVINKTPAELVISSSQPNNIQHLVFMLKSSGDSDFSLTCKSGSAVVLSNKLKTEKRFYFKYHAMVCPSSNKAILKFDRGTHKIRGLRLYK